MNQKIRISHDGVTCLMNLADVPHGELIGSKDFEDGRHIDFYQALPGTQVIAYDEQTGEPKWVDVSGWSRHTGCAVELVQLSNGDTITTDNDPRGVYGMPIDSIDLAMDRATPTEAKERKFMVPLLRQLPETTSLFSAIDFKNGGVPVNTHACHEQLIFDADYDLGAFLGIMAGDGWWSKKENIFKFHGQFHIADLEGYNGNFVVTYFSPKVSKFWYGKHEYKKEEHPDRYGDTVRYSYMFDGSEHICKALSNILGGEGDENTAGSANKHLPFWIMSMSKDFRLGVLNGLIATDGSISISKLGIREHGELVIQLTSTSRRLIDDIKSLCSTLSVSTSISFSKKTIKGNTSWVINLSSVDCKREGIFCSCPNIRKREIFNAAEVSFDPRSIRGDYLPLPTQVADAFLSHIKIRGKLAKAVIEECALPSFIQYAASLYQVLWRGKKDGYITRDFSNRVCEWQEQRDKLALWFDDYIKNFRKRLIGGEKTFPKEEVNTLVEAIAFNAPYFLYDDVLSARAKAGQLRQKGAHFPYQLADALTKVSLTEDRTLYNALSMDPVIKAWMELSVCPVRWAFIERVDKTGQVEEGYDLTVPGYETFASDSGVILSNTMTYYVPVSKKAVQEAYDLMLPSKNQLAARDFKALPEMQEELVSGAWLASHKKNGPVKAVFNTPAEAVAAYRAGKIDVDDNIIIKSQQ